MKPRSHHPVKASKRSSRRPAKKAPKRTRVVRGDDAVALAMGRALMRRPRVNRALLEMMRQNRDLLPL